MGKGEGEWVTRSRKGGSDNNLFLDNKFSSRLLSGNIHSLHSHLNQTTKSRNRISSKQIECLGGQERGDASRGITRACALFSLSS